MPMVSAGHRLTPEEAEALRHGRANMLFTSVLEDKLRRVQSVADARSGAGDRRDHRGAARHHRGQPGSPALDPRRAQVVRREREASSAPVQVVDFEQPGQQRAPGHMGVEDRAARPQGQPGRRHVRGQRPAGGHRRAQEPEGRRRARRAASSSCAGTSRRPRSCWLSTQLYNVTHLLDYWYGVTWNVYAALHLQVEARPRTRTYRCAVQAFFEPTTSCARCRTGSSSTSRTARRRSRSCASTSAGDRQDRRPLRRPRARTAASSGTPRARARPSRC